MTQTPSNLTIGILQTGQNRAELKGRFDEYPIMFDRLLNEQAGPRWTKLETYRVLDGAFPQHIRACDGYIVTGSAAGVYEGHSWIDPLMAFIREAYDAEIHHQAPGRSPVLSSAGLLGRSVAGQTSSDIHQICPSNQLGFVRFAGSQLSG